MRCWLEETYLEHAQKRARPAIAILPVGAVEAHGPHLPLGTDLWIAEAMALGAVERLSQAGLEVVRLPSLVYTPVPFAENFPGTLGIRSETLRSLLEDLHAGLSRSGLEILLLVNAHFDPANVGVLREFARAFEKQTPAVVFPDLTRRRHAERLGDEFRSGACHAGCYETSLLLAIRPELVNLDLALELPDHPVSLVEAIRQGHRRFEQAGGALAYFGFPAKSSREEGERLLEELSTILVEEVLERCEAVKGGRS